MLNYVRQKPLRCALITASIPLALMTACYLDWILLASKFSTVTADQIYQSAAMAPAILVDRCQRHGIRTVIDLRDEDAALVAANATAAEGAGIRHIHLPTRSHPFWDDADAFLDAISSAERPVLVHCEHGEGRSVLMCAIHRIVNEGWSNERAFNGTSRLPDGLRFLSDWIPGLRRFNAAHPKGRFVLEYGTAISERRRAHYEKHEKPRELQNRR